MSQAAVTNDQAGSSGDQRGEILSMPRPPTQAQGVLSIMSSQQQRLNCAGQAPELLLPEYARKDASGFTDQTTAHGDRASKPRDGRV